MFLDADTTRGSFALHDQRQAGTTTWHCHSKHQLLFACSGALQLWLADGEHWLLPRERAAWIPADMMHKVSTTGGYALRTIYFDPLLVPTPPQECGVFTVKPVLREMILYSMRWELGQHDSPLAAAYFSLLSTLCNEWATEALVYKLPSASSEELNRAMHYIQENLETPPTLSEAARAARLSTRTLSRRFQSEADTSFKKFVHAARMLRAAELLSGSDARITEVAMEVGLSSSSALSDAFRRFFGMTPSKFQRQQ